MDFLVDRFAESQHTLLKQNNVIDHFKHAFSPRWTQQAMNSSGDNDCLKT